MFTFQGPRETGYQQPLRQDAGFIDFVRSFRVTSTSTKGGPLSFEFSKGIDVMISSDQSTRMFDTVPSYDASPISSECANLAEQYADAVQYRYAFMADQDKIRARGDDPMSFAHSMIVVPNITGYKSLDELLQDWADCYSPWFVNWYPAQVNRNWLLIKAGCEGVMLGCATASTSVESTLKLQ